MASFLQLISILIYVFSLFYAISSQFLFFFYFLFWVGESENRHRIIVYAWSISGRSTTWDGSRLMTIFPAQLILLAHWLRSWTLCLSSLGIHLKEVIVNLHKRLSISLLLLDTSCHFPKGSASFINFASPSTY